MQLERNVHDYIVAVNELKLSCNCGYIASIRVTLLC